MLQTASVFLLHRLVTPDSMHVLHAVHGVRPVELQVDPELQLVAAFTIVNPKRPCEESGTREGRREEGREVVQRGGHACRGGMQGACWADAEWVMHGSSRGKIPPLEIHGRGTWRYMHAGRSRGEMQGSSQAQTAFSPA